MRRSNQSKGSEDVKCPQCGQWTSVLYTRPENESRKRRYQCANEHRFWTMETIVASARARAATTSAACPTATSPDQPLPTRRR